MNSRSGSNILARGGVGLTVIIMQVSVRIGLNWYWTGTELGKNDQPFFETPCIFLNNDKGHT